MKKIHIILLIIATTLNNQAQVITIPDSMFKAALLNHIPIIDLNGNREIEIDEASQVDSLNLSRKMIYNLKGIEYFIALKQLDCSHNFITNPNINDLLLLKQLLCSGNLIDTLDITQLLYLEELDCFNNLLKSIDLSQNTSLTTLVCNYNRLENLDVSQNTYLTKLLCINNFSLTQICLNNTQLDLATTNTRLWKKPTNASWTTNCITGLDNTPLNTNNKIVRILTLQGQTVTSESIQNGQIYIYQYNDGRAKKMIMIE